MAQSEPLYERARDLTSKAHAVAISNHVRFTDEFVLLNYIDVKWWNFFVTIAGVFVASTRLKNLQLGKDRERHLMEVVAKEFQKWNPNASDGFEDCKAFFDRTYDGQAAALTADEQKFVSSDTVGAWIVWNILDRPPSTIDERRLVRVIGILVTHIFFNWWD